MMAVLQIHRLPGVKENPHTESRRAERMLGFEKSRRVSDTRKVPRS